jgi:cytochrome c oxidase assembly factor 6
VIGGPVEKAMAGDEPKKVLKKAERQRCWDARDRFWDCFRDNGEVKEKCLETRKVFEEACPNSWVVHFDKNYYYRKFKDQVAKEGFKELDEQFGKKK